MSCTRTKNKFAIKGSIIAMFVQRYINSLETTRYMQASTDPIEYL